ncbi:hypothetical protein, partial [Staphylococcus hominis]
NQKNYKKDNFYIISIEIVFFHLSRYFMSRTHHSINISLLCKLLIFVHYPHHFYQQLLLLNLLNDIIE